MRKKVSTEAKHIPANDDCISADTSASGRQNIKQKCEVPGDG